MNTSHYDFLGISLTHRTTYFTTALAPKALIKLSAWTKHHLDCLTMLQTAQWFGSLLWGAQVLEVSLSDLYFILKFFRRRAMAYSPWESQANIWNSFKTLWWNLQQLCMSNVPTHRRYRISSSTRGNRTTAFSDASLDVSGCVVIWQHNITCTGVKWHIQEDINILETRSAEYTIRFVLELIGAQQISPGIVTLELFVDNTTTLFAIRKGWSQKFTTNKR